MSAPRPILLVLLAAAAACTTGTTVAESPDGGDTGGSASTAAASSSAAAASSSGAASSSSSAAAASSSSSAAASSSSSAAAASSSSTGGGDNVVRFVAMGDTGEGNAEQYQVAEAIKNKCDAEGCDFVILLGDNIYDSGTEDVDDPQWQEKFELPYQHINLPFYAVMGNHDYGNGGTGLTWAQGPVAVAYTQHSERWLMPDTHYTFVEDHVGFLALDTNSIFWNNDSNGDQETWVGPALASLNTTWKIVLGHHPYLSNGPHGNAGEYEGLPFVPVANGANVKEFFDEHLCGAVDVYLCGHDHSRQWLERSPDCAAELIVSGAGAKTTELEGENPAHWQSDTEGFLYVVISGDSFHGQFINADGTLGYERTFTRQ